VQCRRDADLHGRRRGCALSAVAVTSAAPFQHRLRQLLQEQWDTIGALDDCFDHVARQHRPSAGDPLDQYQAVAAVQSIERQHRHMGSANPGRRELGAKGDEQQDGQAPRLLDHKVEQLTRGRVDPMNILEDHQHRLPLRGGRELPEQRFERFLLLPLWRKIQRRLTIGQRNGQQIGE
jgi:hypothetical protein